MCKCKLLSVVAALLMITAFTLPAAAASATLPARPGTPGPAAPAHRISTLQTPRSVGNGPPVVIPYHPGPPSLYNPGPAHHGATAVQPPSGIQPNTSGGVSFAGQGPTNYTPADASAADGTQNLVQVVNAQWSAYDFTGSSLFTPTFQNWFGVSGTVSDPHVLFDPSNGGHFVFILTTGTSILMSVSQQASATGNWCNYTFATASGYFADFPELGINENTTTTGTGLYVSTNLLQNGSSTPELLSIDRSEVESCQGVSWYYWTNLKNADGSTAFTVAPAITGSGNFSPTEYLVDSYSGGGCALNIWHLSGSTLSGPQSVGTNCYSPASPAAQAGSSATLSTEDCRLLQAHSSDDGYLETSLTGAYDWGGGNVNSVIWWFKIDPSGPSVHQQGGFGGSGLWYFYPAMMADPSGYAIFVYAVSGSSIDPSVWYIGLNTDGSLSINSLALANGTSPYGTSGVQRWGDYFSAVQDPNGATSSKSGIDITGMYATGGNWATWLGVGSSP